MPRIWTSDADVACAHYWHCEHNHAGQWSRLYELLSRHPYRPGPLEGAPEPDTRAEALYHELGHRDGFGPEAY